MIIVYCYFCVAIILILYRSVCLSSCRDLLKIRFPAMALKWLLAFCFTLASSKCVIRSGGTTALCSDLTEPQCAATNGLCRWDASQVVPPSPSFLTSTGCYYWQAYSWPACWPDCQEDRAACALLTTKEACRTAGRGVGDGCEWWDKDICESDKPGLYLSTWGCKDEESCLAAGGHYCSGCTNDLRTLWRHEELHLEDLMLLTSENRGRCIDTCARGKLTWDDPSVCDKMSNCGIGQSEGRTGYECRDATATVMVGMSLPLCSFFTLLT